MIKIHPDILKRNRLIRCIEECSELQQAITKLQRFGSTPTANGITYDNVADIEREMIDIYRAMRELTFSLNLSWREISEQGCRIKQYPEDE